MSTQPEIPNGNLEEQLRSLQTRLHEKTAELGGIKGAISAIEEKVRTTGTNRSSGGRSAR